MIKFAAKEYDILWNLSGGPCIFRVNMTQKYSNFSVPSPTWPYLVWNILERQGVLGDWEIHTNDDTPTVAVNFGLETEWRSFSAVAIYMGESSAFPMRSNFDKGPYGTLVFFGSTI